MKLDQIERLRAELVRYSDETNNRAAAERSPRERRIEHLLCALLMELEKLKLESGPGSDKASPESRSEKLAAQMLKTGSALLHGQTPELVSDEVANDFLRALQLLDLAQELKEAGKTAALKDKLKGVTS